MSPCPRKSLPEEDIAEVIADDLIADMYATCVAGESYPLTIGKYYIPLLMETAQNSVSFVISSLKVRISLEMLNKLGWNSVEDVQNSVNRWETLSMNAVVSQFNQIKYENELKNIKSDIDTIIDKVNTRHIAIKIARCVNQKYIPETVEQDEFRNNLAALRNFLRNKREPLSIQKFLEKNNDIRPRHLLAQIVECPDVNRNAILMALAYNQGIMNRFL
jgi:hypothetical protein